MELSVTLKMDEKMAGILYKCIKVRRATENVLVSKALRPKALRLASPLAVYQMFAS